MVNTRAPGRGGQDDDQQLLLDESVSVRNMALVGRVADRVTVLAEGRVLASGTPDDVRANPEVQRAYLGDVSQSRQRNEEQPPA